MRSPFELPELFTLSGQIVTGETSLEQLVLAAGGNTCSGGTGDGNTCGSGSGAKVD